MSPEAIDALIFLASSVLAVATGLGVAYLPSRYRGTTGAR